MTADEFIEVTDSHVKVRPEHFARHPGTFTWDWYRPVGGRPPNCSTTRHGRRRVKADFVEVLYDHAHVACWAVCPECHFMMMESWRETDCEGHE